MMSCSCSLYARLCEVESKVPITALDEREKFNLLLAVFLGNQTIRGQSRPRDLLFDRKAVDALQFLECAQAAILRKAFEGRKQTLGSLQLIAIGLHRAIRADSSSVLAWVDQRFYNHVSRYLGEQVVTCAMLRTGNMARSLGKLRDRYRNPMVHSDSGFVVDRSEYHKFCDLAYGTLDLRQWMDLGVSPAYYKPTNLGWISFLTTAAKRPDQGAPQSCLAAFR